MARVLGLSRRGSRYLVTLGISGKEKRLDMSAEEVIEYGIVKGGELDDAVAMELIYREDTKAARKKALSVLSYGDKSKRGLFDRLSRAGYPPEIIEDAVEYAASYGYIDEPRQIERAATRLANESLRSRAYIVAKLASEGYSEEDIEGVIDSLVNRGEIDFSLIGERLAAKLGIYVEDEKRALLYKRGFLSDDL